MWSGAALQSLARKKVERHWAEGCDSSVAEDLLSVLERTQKVFERDLDEMEKLGGKF